MKKLILISIIWVSSLDGGILWNGLRNIYYLLYDDFSKFRNYS